MSNNKVSFDNYFYSLDDNAVLTLNNENAKQGKVEKKSIRVNWERHLPGSLLLCLQQNHRNHCNCKGTNGFTKEQRTSKKIH